MRRGDDLVALAGCRDCAWAVEDGDLATRVTDKATLLQRAGRNGDGGAPGTEHLSDVLLRDLHLFGLDAVSERKQPAGEALFYLMEAIAEDTLRGEHHAEIDGAVYEFTERPHRVDGVAKG